MATEGFGQPVVATAAADRSQVAPGVERFEDHARVIRQSADHRRVEDDAILDLVGFEQAPESLKFSAGIRTLGRRVDGVV